MGKCLMTKLNGVVNNDDLLKVGELEILLKNCTTSGRRMPSLLFEQATEVKAINGLISASYVDGGNKAQTLTISDYSGNMSCYGDGQIKLRIANKYNLSRLSEEDNDYYANSEVNLADLKYCKSLTDLRIGMRSIARGSLEDIKDLPIGKLYLNPETPSDLANISNFTFTPEKYTPVMLGNVFGDIINLHTNLSEIVKITICGASGKSLYGDLSTLGDKIQIFVSNGNTNTDEAFTWGSTTARPSTYSFLPVYNVRFATGTDVDNYLINVANCVFDSGHDKGIIIYCTSGTRSSASDTALATIKSNGYNVTLNGSTL